MKKHRILYTIIPIILGVAVAILGMFKSSQIMSNQENMRVEQYSDFNWLWLYNCMQQDYYEQSHLEFNFRYFLPATYFIIPISFQNKFKQPLYNQDILSLNYGMNKTFLQKSIQFKIFDSKTILKSQTVIDLWQIITKSNPPHQNFQSIQMIQKNVDEYEDILQQDRFIKTYCFQNQFYSNFSKKTISRYISQHEEQDILQNRIFEIQKYLGRYILKNNTVNCLQGLNLFEIEILFTYSLSNSIKRPYVSNIFNLGLAELDIKEQNIVRLQIEKNYLENDKTYKIFKYDYDFRLKRIMTQCVSNYKYHHFWIKQNPDLVLIPSLCDKNQQNTTDHHKMFKKVDILLMKKVDKNQGIIQNLTIHNFLENSDILNNKLSFYYVSQQLDNQNTQYNFSLSFFLPKTYSFNLNSKEYTEEETQFMNLNSSIMWITKPLDQLGGRGIKVYQSSDLIKEYIKQEKNKGKSSSNQQIIVQKYIENPLLVNNKKFDIRCYVIVVSIDPYIVYFLNGYIRLTINSYQKNSTDLLTHLVNTNIQKTHPLFNEKKDDSHWDLQKFEEVLQDEYKLSKLEIENKIYMPMKQSSSYLFKGLQKYFCNSRSSFQIFGLDFMFDEEFNPYFIEVNEIPQLLGKTSTHNKVCPEIVYQQLDSCLYAQGQNLKGEPIDMNILQQKCYNCNLLIHQNDVKFLQQIVQS